MTSDNRTSGPDLRLVAAVFLVAVVILVLRTSVGRAGLPFFADTDDAMRMVMVRDFLAGQAWHDLTAQRLNTPFGAQIHWSRLVDLPIGLLVMAFTPLVGLDQAMVVAGTVWPMALLAALLWLSALLAHRLVGPDGVLPAVVLPVLSPAITAEFMPGRVDHHNVIILLTLAMVWTAIEALQRPRFAMACGLIASTALAIATESLPPIAAAIAVIALAFVIDGRRRAMLAGFGLAFALGAMVNLALFRPPARWLEPACDVLSPFYVGMAIVVGIVFALASQLSLQRPWQRLLVLAVPGLAGLGALLVLYPQCMDGPYGQLDPWLQANWIAAIMEARPWLTSLGELPAYAVAVGVPSLLAVLVVILRLVRVRTDREQWAALLVFLLATALVMLVQVRGARLAIMPAMPAAAWLIVVARQHYLNSPRLVPALGLVASWLGFAGIVLSLLVTAVVALMPPSPAAVSAVRAGKEACLVPSAFADLAPIPPERIMAPIDLGAHIMLYTPHAVVAAPYHRNQQGVRDAFRFFNDPIADARQIIDDRGIGLVVLCPAMPEVAGRPDRATDSFASLYAAGTLPDWLVDVSLPDSPLVVLAVLPQ